MSDRRRECGSGVNGTSDLLDGAERNKTAAVRLDRFVGPVHSFKSFATQIRHTLYALGRRVQLVLLPQDSYNAPSL
jgi:hypothetical protein